MKIPEYISKTEVQKACQELGIRDWTKLTEPLATLDEAKIIQTEVGGEAIQISVEEFKQGLDVELEHGIIFPDANITNNHPILTGMIVLAHLKEMLDYYIRLEVAEIEGDIIKAYKANSKDKILTLNKKLIDAKLALSKSDAKK